MEQTGNASPTTQSRREVQVVYPQHIDAVWHQLGPLIERALEHGQGDETDESIVRQQLKKGDSQLWVVTNEGQIEAATVVSVMDSPKTRKLSIEILAGEKMSAWVELLEDVMLRFKKELGASCIEASCRPGLAKQLRERGWTQKAVIMELV